MQNKHLRKDSAEGFCGRIQKNKQVFCWPIFAEGSLRKDSAEGFSMRNKHLRKDSAEGFCGRIPEGSAEGSSRKGKKITSSIIVRENHDFCKNCVFDKNAQIARFCLRFRKPKRRKSVQNSNPKTCCFEASNLKGFSLNFRCILESKNRQNIANIRKK